MNTKSIQMTWLNILLKNGTKKKRHSKPNQKSRVFTGAPVIAFCENPLLQKIICTNTIKTTKNL